MAYAQSLFSIYIFWASFGFFLFFYFVRIFLKFNWILTGTVQKYVCCLGQMHIHFSCPRENLYCQNCNELFAVYPFFNPFRWHQLHWNVIKIETRSSLCSPLFCEPGIPILLPVSGWLWMAFLMVTLACSVSAFGLLLCIQITLIFGWPSPFPAHFPTHFPTISLPILVPIGIWPYIYP